MADIKPGRRLIKQHNRRLLRQYHCNPRPLALAAGEGIHALQREVDNTRRPHRVIYRCFVLFTPTGKHRLMRIAPARHQLLYGDIAGRGGILRQQADPLRHLFAGVVLDLLAIEINVSAGRRHQTAKGTQQG